MNLFKSKPKNSPSKKKKKKTKQDGVRAQRENIFAQKLDMTESYKPPFYPKSEAAYEFIDGCLGDNFVFQNLSSKERRLLIDAMQTQEVPGGEPIVTQGETGDYFYVVDEGTVRFEVDSRKVGQCGRGGSFGELALLYNCPRSASCVAETTCTLWIVDQKTFRHMLANTQNTQNKETHGILKKVSFFSDLEDRDLTRIADAFSTQVCKAGDRIITKGEIGDNFYIIQEGTAKVHDIGQREGQFIEQSMGAGAFFGERALLTGEPRNASITATSERCVLLKLGREEFKVVLGPLQAAIDRAMSKRTLLAVPIFIMSQFEAFEMNRLADLVVEMTFRPGTVLAQQGKPLVQNFYVVRQGKVRILHQNSSRPGFLSDSDYFGQSFLKEPDGAVATQTITVMEETRCGVLSKKDFLSVVGNADRLGRPRRPKAQSAHEKAITLKELSKIRILGVGTFGKVWLVTQKKTGTPYALKMLSKYEIIQHQQVGSVAQEKNVMSMLDHPFVISLVGSFMDSRSLYMVLELVQGGELFSVIHTESMDGVPNGNARFYAACILESLSHLHMRNIAYRDLKPENVLVDNKGYCVLVDLGFAKVVDDKTYTLCGTPEYLAPEIILSKGHDKGADYWAYGVLIYEMVVGHSPFFDFGSNSQADLFQRICKVQYSFPGGGLVHHHAQDLIKRLIIRRQASRMGCLARGDMDIRDHPWFEIIDVDKLLRRKWPAPWVPRIRNALDSSHFDSYEHLEKDSKKDPSLTASEQALFKDF
ncbi:MAP kinase-activated protein kinase 2 (Fragment) [Seminavis robusta]|uniref:cGMP-dependent protein kinase n=1 Tax=Seminavis robusta TaxID=568900 RepID=A0A9N8DCF8_9STRA